MIAFYESCQPVTGCLSLAFEASLGRVELTAAWFMTSVIIGPASEEIVFRGFLLAGVVKFIRSPIIAIIIVAFVFIAAHADVQQLHPKSFAVLWRLVSGLLYGLLRWKFGSLWPAIAAHLMADLFHGYPPRLWWRKWVRAKTSIEAGYYEAVSFGLMIFQSVLARFSYRVRSAQG